MVDIYLVIGAGGVVGRKVMALLESRGKCVHAISTELILNAAEAEISLILRSAIHQKGFVESKRTKVALILAHRVRSSNIYEAMHCEIRITRDLVRALSSICMELRVTVLGSVTGRLVDGNSPESYHYVKDFQKSCVRYSIMHVNTYMNLLELSWFEKYSALEMSEEYTNTLACIESTLGPGHIVSIEDITDFLIDLAEMRRPPRGEVITFDGGYSLLQR